MFLSQGHGKCEKSRGRVFEGDIVFFFLFPPMFDEFQLYSYSEQTLGCLHPDFVAITHELAVFYQENGNLRSALSLHQRTLKLASAIGMHRNFLKSYMRAVRETEEAFKNQLMKE
jgi:hypothetical protein